MPTSGSSSTPVAAWRLTTMAKVGGAITSGWPAARGGPAGRETRARGASGAGGPGVAVDRVRVADRGGELGDLGAAHLVDGRGRVAAPDQSWVQRHAPALRSATDPSLPTERSAGLAVHRVPAVLGAVLFQLEPVGVVAPVLAGD